MEIIHPDDLPEATRNAHGFHAQQILQAVEHTRSKMPLDSKTLSHVTGHALSTLPFRPLEKQVIATRTGEKDADRVLRVIAGRCRKILG